MNNISQEDYLTAIFRNLDEAGEIKPNLLEEFLDYPEFDPHGYPIPDKNGKIKKSKSVVAITELSENDIVKVIRVNDDVKNLLSYITKIGISLGKEIIIKDKLEYDGSVLVKIDNKEMNISNKIASNIFVEKIN